MGILASLERALEKPIKLREQGQSTEIKSAGVFLTRGNSGINFECAGHEEEVI